MPDFILISPEGKKYKVTGPPGATKADAFQILQSQLAGQEEAAQPPQPEVSEMIAPAAASSTQLPAGQVPEEDKRFWGDAYRRGVLNDRKKGVVEELARRGEIELDLKPGIMPYTKETFPYGKPSEYETTPYRPDIKRPYEPLPSVLETLRPPEEMPRGPELRAGLPGPPLRAPEEIPEWQKAEAAPSEELYAPPPAWKKVVSGMVRPTFEAVGTGFGAAVGSGANITAFGVPVGSYLGGGLGFTEAAKAADVVDVGLGLKKPETAKEAAISTVQEFSKGLQYEALGVGLRPIFSAGGRVLNFLRETRLKHSPFPTAAGAEKKAADLLIAETSGGTIYARNAEEAAQLEAQIPGLKFDLAQSRYDPGLTRLKRGLIRKSTKGAQMEVERIASNNEAVLQYYQKNFPEEQGVDEIITALENKQRELVKIADGLGIDLQKTLQRVRSKAEYDVGVDIVGGLNTAMEPVKQEMDRLRAAIQPDIPMSFKRVEDEVSALLKKQISPNKAKALKKFQSFFNETKAKGETVEMYFALNEALNDQIEKNMNKDGGKATARLLLQIKDSLKASGEDLASYYVKGEEIANSIKAFNKYASEEYFAKYQTPALKRALNPKTPAEQIPRLFRNETAALELKTALGEEQAREVMRNYAAHDLLQNVTNQEHAVIKNKFNAWKSKNLEFLNRFNLVDEFDNVGQAQDAVVNALRNLDQFEKGITKRVLGADPKNMMSTILSGNNPARKMSELLKEVGPNKEAVNGIKKSFADYMTLLIEEEAEGGEKLKLVRSDVFKRNMEKASDIIKILYRKEPEKIKALQNIRKVYEISTRAVKSPTPGGSDTAEILTTFYQKLGNLAMGAGKFVAKPFRIVQPAWRTLGIQSKKDAEDLLIEALFDPEYAQVLYNRNINPEEYILNIQNKLIKLGQLKRMRFEQFGGAAAAGTGAFIEQVRKPFGVEETERTY